MTAVDDDGAEKEFVIYLVSEGEVREKCIEKIVKKNL